MIDVERALYTPTDHGPNVNRGLHAEPADRRRSTAPATTSASWTRSSWSSGDRRAGRRLGPLELVLRTAATAVGGAIDPHAPPGAAAPGRAPARTPPPRPPHTRPRSTPQEQAARRAEPRWTRRSRSTPRCRSTRPGRRPRTPEPTATPDAEVVRMSPREPRQLGPQAAPVSSSPSRASGASRSP